MNELHFIYTVPFLNKWHRLGYTELDQQNLESSILDFYNQNPANQHGKLFPGEIIQGTHGAYKLRFKPDSSNAGKSGSSRIIYCVITGSSLAFLDVYPKNQRVSLSNREKQTIAKVIQLLKEKER